MEANELRIGNIVGFYKPLKSDLQIGTISSISEAEVDVPEFSENVGISYKGITGIPLTEEWLLKFGIVGKWVSRPYWVEIRLNKDGIADLYMYYMGHAVFLRNVQYVHELQNFHFALTRQELLIK